MTNMKYVRFSSEVGDLKTWISTPFDHLDVSVIAGVH